MRGKILVERRTGRHVELSCLGMGPHPKGTRESLSLQSGAEPAGPAAEGRGASRPPVEALVAEAPRTPQRELQFVLPHNVVVVAGARLSGVRLD